MSCQSFAAALVDEASSPPPGLEEHLTHCEDCRALARLHRSARHLRLAEPAPLPASFTPESIVRVVRRRRQRRAWAAGAGATCAAILLALAVRTPQTPVEAPAEELAQGAPVEGVIQAEPTRSVSSGATVHVTRVHRAGQGSLLEELLSEVEGYSHTRPAVEDRAYEPFGLLALWIRPPESTALDAEPFRSALWLFQPSRSK